MKREYILEKDGFRAIWFEGNENRDRVIIYMSGAGINEKMTIDASKYLRDAGYSILCLGFYLWDGLPKEMWRIPVEYVERAVAELKTKVDSGNYQVDAGDFASKLLEKYNELY